MKKVLVLALLTAVVATSGCATILSGKTQKVNLTTSNGKSATVTMNGETHTAPGIVDIARKGVDATVNATGECQGQTLAAKTINPVFWVNILSGGAFGSTTDYSTDSMWQYQSNIEIKCS